MNIIDIATPAMVARRARRLSVATLLTAAAPLAVAVGGAGRHATGCGSSDRTLHRDTPQRGR
jgi:hypothetical protein